MSDTDDIRIAPISPFVYTATFFFTMSAFSSDLLFIRFSLMSGFLFLVLASFSSYSLDGSFSTDTMPFVDGSIDITLIINMCLFLLNFLIVGRFIKDEFNFTKFTAEEFALYRFFHSRCGMHRMQFDEVLKHGRFYDVEAGDDVPMLGSTLYLVLEGIVEVTTTPNFGDTEEGSDIFLKRSGQFFDIKLFNIFTLPVGFDSYQFEAKAVKRTRLFGWNAKGLVAMRDCQSPKLQQFWEYMVLRVLSASAVRHQLRETDTVYDAWLIPEDKEWLEGRPSRDFAKNENPNSAGWSHFCQQVSQLYNAMFHIFPPKGIRHASPYMALKRNPKQEVIELMAMAKQECVDLMEEAHATPKDFRFIMNEASPPSSPRKLSSPKKRPVQVVQDEMTPSRHSKQYLDLLQKETSEETKSEVEEFKA